eukprot:NODE_5288_length_588_cov_39.330241_g4579_i0.p1 GENE.NODE_5288_length_588_cov_39.330241_g4579_i0~~NODE_5288_length_588_cov_39.330241_g4579_i0.p1  ORF type:complete len:131 (-),score=49.91 NODE_5288_length_588_cov_39.330241_g4579_i0:196-552(-)
MQVEKLQQLTFQEYADCLALARSQGAPGLRKDILCFTWQGTHWELVQVASARVCLLEGAVVDGDCVLPNFLHVGPEIGPEECDRYDDYTLACAKPCLTFREAVLRVIASLQVDSDSSD